MEVCLRNLLSAIERGPRGWGHHHDGMARRPRRIGVITGDIGRSPGGLVLPSPAWNLDLLYISRFCLYFNADRR